MTITELIEHLENVRNICGDIPVVAIEDVCGIDRLNEFKYVSIEVDHDGNKYVAIRADY